MRLDSVDVTVNDTHLTFQADGRGGECPPTHPASYDLWMLSASKDITIMHDEHRMLVTSTHPTHPHTTVFLIFL
jgi:hypothetical protein